VRVLFTPPFLFPFIVNPFLIDCDVAVQPPLRAASQHFLAQRAPF
jgi:hypothetical protein